MTTARILTTLLVFSGALGAAPASAQTAENVALVINEASADSQRIAEHYIRARGIPPSNVVRIKTTTQDSVDRATFEKSIAAPIADALRRQAVHDRILYIVVTKGIPLRVEGSDGLDGTVASVDSEITLLYRRMTGANVPPRGRVPNPYYLGTRPLAEATRFTHRTHDIYLVSRLDAFTVEEALALIDRAQTPTTNGRIVLDQRSGIHRDQSGDVWLSEAARRLAALGFDDRVVFEQTTRPARKIESVLGYYSWGSNDDQNRTRRFEMQFVPGAIAATFVSSDARTFQNPPDAWSPSDTWNRSGSFAGTPQSLVGDLLREGATGVAGHVAEPYLQSTVRPEILFPAYLSGFNLVEAFYLAIPHLSWQTVVVGDPLCAPFRQHALTRAEIEDPLDKATELPALFSARRVEQLRAAQKTAPPAFPSLIARAESRLARDDVAGGIQALEEATSLAPAIVGPQLLLSSLYANTGQRQQANDRLRIVIQHDPTNVMALNDLAYSLAVHEKAVAEALPLARRAAARAPTNAAVLDTLGWLEHLAGNNTEAATLLSDAVRRAPEHAEIHVHLGIVHAALGDLGRADASLSEALRLNPALEKSEDVRRLRTVLTKR
jgi:uncharacterized protein (TIGR03790 family)